MRGPKIEDPDITAPLKTKQVNIGTEEEPKYATLGDYWDDATVEKVVKLLWEYRYLFPTKITELKGILGDLGMMKITLKPDVKQVKQQPYQLNPKYKAKVRVDLRKLNDACVNDPFPTSFIDEVLENVGGQEAYSFMDGFSRYHQIKIAPKDRSKTTFATEWGCFQYIVMPFGLKYVLAIFSRIVVATFKEFIHKLLEVYIDG